MSNKRDYKADFYSPGDFFILQMMQRSPKLAEALVRYLELLTGSEVDALPFTEMKRLREIIISEAYELGRADNDVK